MMTESDPPFFTEKGRSESQGYFQEAQVTPWLSKAEQLIQYVANFIEKETA